MLKDKKIAVVVPAYNEELLIRTVIETMPEFVDAIYIVDDCSTDGTVARVEAHLESPNYSHLVKLIKNKKNQGVGTAITKGYRTAEADKMDVVAVMAGDAQMDPDDLIKIVMPVVEDKADYTKGNRLFTGEAWDLIPRYRYLGNATLSLLTKIASGYWHVADSQTGYTALSLRAIKILPLEKLYARYGYPNHMLVMLNIFNMRVRDVPVKPVYNIGEKSGIKLYSVVPRLSRLLLVTFLWRMREKYIIRDFHPLIFFYMLAFLLLGASLPLGLRIFWIWYQVGGIPAINTLAVMFTIISGLQALFFAMWFDLEYNKSLSGD
ncbi:MAG: glycosyltransferase family 2 protein [Chloroflexi bacterium]|nr:MAG: glycosyltransferase family 2 protein [Chloroflexota bacterium]MBL1193112.1 glycosyltransferase family 2 protein [Chloroflexota bacterium]NOH10404.1 glycosyltransferase family 2 protein [Chloroflexota bacterium]